MLKSVEGKVVPNENEKDVKKLKRSAKKSGRKSQIKESPRGPRSRVSTPPEQRDTTLVIDATTGVPQSSPEPKEEIPKDGEADVNVPEQTEETTVQQGNSISIATKARNLIGVN